MPSWLVAISLSRPAPAVVPSQKGWACPLDLLRTKYSSLYSGQQVCAIDAAFFCFLIRIFDFPCRRVVALAHCAIIISMPAGILHVLPPPPHLLVLLVP